MTIEEVVQELVKNNIIKREVADLLTEANTDDSVLTDYNLEPTYLLKQMLKLMNKQLVQIIKDDNYLYELKPITKNNI